MNLYKQIDTLTADLAMKKRDVVQLMSGYRPGERDDDEFGIRPRHTPQELQPELQQVIAEKLKLESRLSRLRQLAAKGVHEI